ncbi:uncharacterized protein LOC123530188 [Mercenaria mercenaria]|uniref:uncharacterized protein LOC123530188 n=1 Tax=Mercenaria mercenaria TaxID=6596 RepID=UPI00234E5DD7|nr:uncharacterized protein LOC123530188 [Mercenaria mercenaria]
MNKMKRQRIGLFVIYVLSLFTLFSLVRFINYEFILSKVQNIFNKRSDYSTNQRNDISNLANNRNHGGNVNKASYAVHPRVILQYGRPRTASTLQFQILCTLLAVMHEHEKNAVGCYFDPKHDKQQLKRYTVIKTHSLKTYVNNLPSDSWIFMTSGNNQPKNDLKMIQNLNLTVPFIADLSMAKKLGHLMVYKYQTISRIPDEQMQHVVEYLRYWDILRLCCGTQMSKTLQTYLINKTHDAYRQSSCKSHNISEIETLVMKTQIFRTFSHDESIQDVIGKPSQIDGDLNGSYCQRCNEIISKGRIPRIDEACI